MLAHLVYVPGPRERVDDIVSKLNLTEKIAFGSPTKAPFCACHTAPTAGLPDYKWLTETNSCVDSPCHPDAPGKCATIFVGPNNMAASFNRSSWRAKGDVVSTDLRAFNNIGDAMVGAKKNHGLGAGSGVATDEYGLLGLSGYGPNINVIKDPRCVHPLNPANLPPCLPASHLSSVLCAGRFGAPVAADSSAAMSAPLPSRRAEQRAAWRGPRADGAVRRKLRAGHAADQGGQGRQAGAQDAELAQALHCRTFWIAVVVVVVVNVLLLLLLAPRHLPSLFRGSLRAPSARSWHRLGRPAGWPAGWLVDWSVIANAPVRLISQYSVETGRFEFSANVTDFTLHDSNLPQYQAAFMEGNASGAMCSYFAPNGVRAAHDTHHVQRSC